ncbi:MAG: ChaN family lipoprotein [Hyphomicrobiaceae bacterium]
MFLYWLFALVLFTGTSSYAASRSSPIILSGTTLNASTVSACLADVKPGTIVVLGERHRNDLHQAYQLMVMSELRSRGLAVSVGMEFLDRPDQSHLDDFRRGRTNETEFLRAVSWKGSLDHYRDQILFPAAAQNTIALNVARRVTTQIANQGLKVLNAEDRKQLPKDFAIEGRGNDLYFQRFKAAMPREISESDKIENYFMAQSAWDDTMAWTATEYIRSHPQEVLVIVVGDFHVIYNGGLPERLRKRGATDVVTISMLPTAPPMTRVEKEQATSPHGPDGPRADWIWLAPE